jgi:putative ABC transport system permease protein
MLTHYLKIAWRSLWKNKFYSLINIIGLTLGLACTLLITIWIQNEYSYNRFHVNGDRLYQVMANLNWGAQSTTSSVPGPLSDVLKKDIPEVKYVATLISGSNIMTVGDNVFKEKGYYVNPDFLKMFSFPLLKGDTASALSMVDGIVISEKLAEKYFGDEQVIGKTIIINNKDPFVVRAVVREIPANSSLQFDWLIPLDYYRSKNGWLKSWGNYSAAMYVMLNQGTSLNNVNGKVAHLLQQEAGDTSAKDAIFLQPFQDIYLHGKYEGGKASGGRIEYVRLFAIIACLVLVIACANFMNLSTARSMRRIKEVGIRKVIGAKRSIIVIQFLCEAFILTLFSLLLALAVVILILPAFETVLSRKLTFTIGDPVFIAAALATTLLTSIVAGSYPAFFLSSFQPLQVLRAAFLKSGHSSLLRKGLIALQFTLSILLIIGTLIVSRQMQYIRNKNIGMDKEHLLIVAYDGGLKEHADAFEHELTASPGIVAVTRCSNNPIDISGTSADIKWSGRAANQVVSISAASVGYDFLKTLGVPLVAGRDFSRDMADSNNYLINESAARLMNMKDPVGQMVTFWNGKGKIVGVVKDFHLHSLYESITPLILCLQPDGAAIFLIRTAGGQTPQAVTSLQKAYDNYNHAYPFQYHFMDALYEKNYKSEMIQGDLVRFFAIIAVLISCLGLFGLAAYTTEQRTKEIGIRKVLGASVNSITLLISMEFIPLIGVAILIAFPLAWLAANNWLNSFAYRVSVGWEIFAEAGVLTLSVAIATVSYQAVKAAIANPIRGLRS